MSDRWTPEQARVWHERQPWLVGCNFIPSTAINPIEMWQAATYDAATIERELGWAQGLGFNSVRVYLHDLLWVEDAPGFKHRIDRFLTTAARHAIRPVLVLFDDCWNQQPALGPQPAPQPGIHNSGWVQSPGSAVVLDSGQWGRLADYVGDVVGAFGRDERVLMWDLYNEPGNNHLGERSLGLLSAAVGWARVAQPRQPLTIGLWNESLAALNDFQLANSDVITFHNYQEAASLERQIATLQPLGRPILCTEYLARTQGSRFETHLPIFRRANVGCYNWGLVSGKTQTVFPWGSQAASPEPAEWFHDILRPDGSPYSRAEVSLIRAMTLAADQD